METQHAPMLTSLSLPTTLNASEHNLADDFFVPILKIARRYDRGVGYFSSGWLKTVSAGLVTFADNEGQMRLLASPVLDAEDWEAMEIGEAARHDRLLHDVLKRNIDDLAQTLAGDTLSALAWMIADGVITLRLALPINKLEGGEFHTKFGIFTDSEGNQISFEGSNNETVRGTILNYERFKVFCSWKDGFAELVQADVETFARLWTVQICRSVQ